MITYEDEHKRDKMINDLFEYEKRFISLSAIVDLAERQFKSDLDRYDLDALEKHYNEFFELV